MNDRPNALVLGVPVEHEHDALTRRLQAHRRRLRESLEAVQLHAISLTPAHQLRTSPIAWVFGAAILGFLLGASTAPRR